jgi:cytochrome oxidase Cu insertion factor (SCO1/SenC/PrrC family)
MRGFRVLAAAAAFLVAGCASAASSGPGGGASSAAAAAAMSNPNLDLGTSLGGVAAPDLALVNQFGQHVALSQFRGKVVLLGFEDSQCTTVCPLTTTAMVDAKELLGAAGSQVQLLGVDANPDAISVSDVLAYSQAHGLVNRWDFLTGSSAQLKAAWGAYHVAVQIEQGQIDHTPALFVIDQQGREQKLYLTQMAYSSVTQSAQVLADEIATLLPGHPRVASQDSLAAVTVDGPDQHVTLGTPAAGTVSLGPGQPRLLMFFATWLSETSDLPARLSDMNDYAAYAQQHGLPRLLAVDTTAVEPSVQAVRAYLAGLGHPLAFPVALDPSGKVADGYQVQDQPWFALVNSAGKIVWSHDGWLPVTALEAAGKKA